MHLFYQPFQVCFSTPTDEEEILAVLFNFFNPLYDLYILFLIFPANLNISPPNIWTYPTGTS